MANDFDNDDLSWLRGKDADPEDSDSDDDLPDFDWLLGGTDEATTSRTGSSSTGLTGQLPWQQGMRDETSTGDQSARLGVTGQLDWRRAGGGDSGQSGEQDLESLFADMDDSPDEWASTTDWENPDDVFAADIENRLTTGSTGAALPPTSSSPTLDTSDDEDDVPDWLQGMLEDVAAEDEPAIPAAPPLVTPPVTEEEAPFFDFSAADEFDTLDELEDNAAFEPASDSLPDWLLNAAPAPTPVLEPEDEDDEVDSLAGLFDDMQLDSAAPDVNFDDAELNFDDVAAPFAYADVAANDLEDEDDDLFASLLASRADEADFEDSADSIAPPQVFSPEALQGFEDYSLLEALDAPDGTGTGASVSDDFFSSLLDDDLLDDDEEEVEAPQTFNFDPAPPAPRTEPVFSLDTLDTDDDSLQWMSDLDTLDDLSQAPTRETAVENVDDFFASLAMYADNAPASSADVDSDLLVSGDDIDFNRLLSDPAFADYDAEVEDIRSSFERPAPIPGSPEWLADVRIQEVSASALVRQQQDRPVEELPSRLQALRQRGLDLPTVEASDQAATAPVFEPTEAAIGVPQGQTGQITLSPEQASKVALLRSVTHSDVQPIEARPRPVGNLRGRLARAIASILIAAAVLIPFVSSFRIGSLPPSSFAVGSSQQAAFAAVDDLRPRDLVLFAAEYGGSNAGELDGLADVLLRHTLLKGAVPVVISTNPIGLLRMDRNLSQISDGLLLRDRDYYIGRYIAGDDIGLRSLNDEIGAFTATDSNGRPTNLNITSLDDFAAIILITGEVTSVRNWSEQVAPLTQSPLLFAVSSSVSPVAQPYADAGERALLVGYRDTYTYADELNALIDAGAVPLIEFATRTSTPESTEVPPTGTSTPAVEVITTDEAAEEATGATGVVTNEPAVETPTQDAGAEATEITATVSPTTQADVAATATTADEDTATGTPTSADDTVEDTVEPSATLNPTSDIDATNDAAGAVFGTVTSDEPINVRSGAGTDFSPVGVLQPGERFEVLGENDDGSWINVQLANGTRGWVFAQLVEIESPSTSIMPPQVAMSVLHLGGMGMGSMISPVQLMQPPVVIQQAATNTPRPTLSRTATEEGTEESQAIVGTRTLSAGNTNDSANPDEGLDLRVELPYREERWYGMTFGIVVIVVVIVIGNIIGLLSRRTARSVRRER